MADSVKCSHIIVPFIGTAAATPDTKTTEEEAKKRLDFDLTLYEEKFPEYFERALKAYLDVNSFHGQIYGPEGIRPEHHHFSLMHIPFALAIHLIAADIY